MKIIGITGGIGSGKSTVCDIICKNGFDVIDADKIAREILKNEDGKDLLAQLVAGFTEDIIVNGKLDRKKLASLAFSDSMQKKKLDDIMLPEIIRTIKLEIYKFEKLGKKIVFLDAPLLFEAGLHRICFESWLVYADEQIRICRVMKRDKASESEVRMRVRFQMPDDEKLKLADFVIDNSKELYYMEKQLKSRLKELI
ncbi:MAG: dephospho-CoA kinase [Eubacteriales bacterium]